MKMFHVKRQLLALFMPGFLLGILYVNLEAEQFAAGAGIFSEYFLKQYRAADILTGEYIWYLLQVRLLPFLVLLGSAFTKFRKAAVILFLIWTGFSAGLLFSMAVLGMGVKGSILCIAGMLPPVFMLYSSVSDRGVVCVLLPAYAVEYTEKSGFRRSSFSWYRVRTVCKSGFGRRIFENPLSRDEMF